MPKYSISNSSSSSTDAINYDSDVSEDEHAIAEDGDDINYDSDVSEDDDEFELELNTLTGGTFNVTIHPSDTLEMLKTRIAFQEGISPADQNLLLQDHGKLLDSSCSSSTLEELNIDRNSKVTLVTNMASGTTPFKTLPQGDELSPSPPVHNLAPLLKRNYRTFNTSHIHNNNYHHVQQQSSSSSTTSLRLPKISAANNTPQDNLSEGSSSSMQTGSSSNQNLQRVDERAWMQSLFNKVVQDDRGQLIDMDSTRTAATAVSYPQEVNGGNKPTRYGRNSRFAQKPEEDGSLLIVEGDDGVILIIQKTPGELLDNSSNGNNWECVGEDGGRIRTTGVGFDVEVYSGKISRLGSSRKFQDSRVRDRIKENAVTLEKMKEVRGMMARRKEGSLPPRPPAPLKGLEFPKILERSGISGSGSSGINGGSQELGPGKGRNGGSRTNQSGGIRNRSINSSKMSLNRLIAEIYLQSKRKGHAFQPGQPPYTEQQLLRYVQLKIAIVLEEQRKSKIEPCSKCQLHGEWLYDKTGPPYIIPTVVIERFKGFANGRRWKSMEDEGDQDTKTGVRAVNSTLRRKSMIPVGTSYKSLIGGTHSTTSSTNQCKMNAPATNTTLGSSTQFKVSSTHAPVPAPSLKTHPKMYFSGKDSSYRRAQSRPGSSSKTTSAKKASVRCPVCKKKIGIACRYQCRCGMTFCSVHRYPEAHECTFDYKTEGRKQIRENNPVVVAPKIQEI